MTTILFDVDGVFLSEECFDVSALTVEELLIIRYLNLDGRKFVTDYSEENIKEIRSLFLQRIRF